MALRIAVRSLIVAVCLAGTAIAYAVHHSNNLIADAFREVLAQRVGPQTVTTLTLAKTPFNPDGLRKTSLAIALVKTGHPAAGERTARDAVRDEPESVTAWVVLARVEATLGKRDQARIAFARARALNSQIAPIAVPPPL